NSFYDFRYEGATKIYISDTTHYATISNGFNLLTDHVEDKGSSTTIQSTNQFIVNRTQATQLRNNGSSSRSVLEVLNSLGTNKVISLYGNGDFSSNGIGYFKR